MKLRILAATLVMASGCASSSGAGDGRVEVYFTGDEVPCAYEVEGAVEAQVRVIGRTEWRRAAVRELGRIGAHAGYDAVFVETGGESARVVPVDRGERGSATLASQQPPVQTITGDGLRYTEPGCSL